MSTPASSIRLYSREDLAREWNCSKDCIRRLERSGKLRSRRVGNKLVRFAEADVLAFLATQPGREAEGPAAA